MLITDLIPTDPTSRFSNLRVADEPIYRSQLVSILDNYSAVEKGRFSQTANGTVGNTLAETTLLAAGEGTLNLPANFLVVGKTVRLRMRGFFSRSGGATLQLRFKIGSTTIVASAAASPATVTNAGFLMDIVFTCRTVGGTGTVFGQGYFHNLGVSTVLDMVATATSVVDTTNGNTLNVTAQWSVAAVGNTITATNVNVEVVR